MTIAFLHAHPDDEAIFTGGTLARLAAAGYRTVVVVATSGELGRNDGGTGPLASRRRAETHAACVELGVAALHFLHFHDSGLGADADEPAATTFAAAHTHDAAALLAEVLVAESAEELVSYDGGGIYGHPDHVQVHRVGRAAAALAGVTTLYEATVDREYLHFVETHLVEHAHRSLPQLGTLGSPTVEIDTTVDVRSVLDAKRRAIDAHVSQVPGDPAAWIPGAGFADVYGYEWYLRLGPPGTLDSLVRDDLVPSSEPGLPIGGRPLS